MQYYQLKKLKEYTQQLGIKTIGGLAKFVIENKQCGESMMQTLKRCCR